MVAPRFLTQSRDCDLFSHWSILLDIKESKGGLVVPGLLPEVGYTGRLLQVQLLIERETLSFCLL